MKKIYFFYLLFLLPFVLKAQVAEVDNKFKGEWIFDQAIVHEKLQGGSELTKWQVTMEEFFQYEQFSEVPVEISFYEAYDGLIATAYGRHFVQPVINGMQQLEFREIVKHDDQQNDDVVFRIVEPVFSNLSLGFNSMNVQYDYTYRNEQNQVKEGYAIIFYRKK